MTSDRGRLQQVLGGSALAAVRSWPAESRFVAGLQAVATRLGRAVRASWLYGWLTAEPEPEVIVIDLRETRLVGPVIDLLDRIVDRTTPYWRSSRLHDGVVALAQVGQRLAATRVGRRLATVLTPPDAVTREDQPDDRTE